MDKLTHTKALLDNISLSEGSDFVFDENAILNEYQKLGENKSSLAIKILSILGGFLATLTFLGFLAIAGLYESEFALLILGIVFISSAIWLNKKYDKLIIDTFSISIYVIGFVLFSYGSFQFINENIIIVLVGFIALLSLFITQNYILSFISVLTVSASLLTLIIYNDFYNLIHLHIALNTLFLTFIFLNEAKIISYNRKLSKLYNPLRIA